MRLRLGAPFGMAVPALAALAAAGCGGIDDSATAPDGARSKGASNAMPDARGIEIDEPRELPTRGGEYRVTWEPVGGFVPINEPFEALVSVRTQDGALVPGARVSFDCFMPAHGHGMLREPRSDEEADGRYRVRGLLLYMGGSWSVSITVVGADGVAATADDELAL